MKRIRLFVVVIGLATAVTIALAGCLGPVISSDESEFEVGENVAAKWTDGNYWYAEVRAVGDGEVTIEYADDKSKKTISTTEVRSIPARKWKVGEKVLAVWTTGRFYDAVITRVGEHSCEVQWDDGSAPSEVPVDRIITR